MTDTTPQLRNADERTVEATWQRIGQLLDRFTPQDCANYFANVGYASIYRDHALVARNAETHASIYLRARHGVYDAYMSGKRRTLS